MEREGRAAKATGAKFSAALLQRCYFNFAARRNLAPSTTSFSRSVAAIAYYTRQGVFIRSSEAPHGRHVREERRKILFSLI